MTPEYDPKDSPTYWFAILEHAKQASDFELAAEAKQNLDRLGVSVKYRRAKTSMDRKGVRNDR